VNQAGPILSHGQADTWGIVKRSIEGPIRTQSALFPEVPDDYVTDANSVRVVDVFVDELDLCAQITDVVGNIKLSLRPCRGAWIEPLKACAS
jgi:hypothetical protein